MKRDFFETTRFRFELPDTLRFCCPLRGPAAT